MKCLCIVRFRNLQRFNENDGKTMALLNRLEEQEEYILDLKRENNEQKAALAKSFDANISMQKDMHKMAQKMAEDILRTVFTPGQMKRLISQQQRVQWSTEDITSAIFIRLAQRLTSFCVKNEKFLCRALQLYGNGCL